LLERLQSLFNIPEVKTGFKSQADCLSWASKVAPLLKFNSNYHQTFMFRFYQIQGYRGGGYAAENFRIMLNQAEMAIEELKLLIENEEVKTNVSKSIQGRQIDNPAPKNFSINFFKKNKTVSIPLCGVALLFLSFPWWKDHFKLTEFGMNGPSPFFKMSLTDTKKDNHANDSAMQAEKSSIQPSNPQKRTKSKGQSREDNFKKEKSKIRIDNIIEESEVQIGKIKDSFIIDQQRIINDFAGKGFISGNMIIQLEQSENQFDLKVDDLQRNTKKQIQEVLFDIDQIQLEKVPFMSAQLSKYKGFEANCVNLKATFKSTVEQSRKNILNR